MPHPIDILIADGTVVTMDPERRVIAGGAVAIAGGRIVDVGDTAELTRRFAAATRIEARHHVVMPGLIDGHSHAGHGLVKTMGGGDTDKWMAACETIYATGSTPAFWHAEAMLTALERLKCGTTCSLSILGGGADILRTDDPLYGERFCAAIAAVGIRTVMAVGPGRPPFPRRYVDWRGASARETSVSFRQQMDTAESLIAHHHRAEGGRINVCVTFPVNDRATLDQDAALAREIVEQGRAARDLSRRRGVLFTQDGHMAGTIATAQEAFGFLGPDAVFSHSIDLTERDIALCRETDTKIVHNPSAIMSIRGRCPVPELIDAGVTVALGSDGTAPDRSADMFRHMFQCMHYQRRHFRDAAVLPPGKVLEMTTIDAARALGLEREIGSLEIGKRADVILVDMRKPHLMPLNMPVYRLVCFATGADVDTVIVDGRILMRGRKVMTVDEDAVLDGAERESELMIERTGLRPLLDLPEGFWRSSRYPN